MARSRVRPAIYEGPSDRTLVSNGTAYLLILNAVNTRQRLIHGALEQRGEYCAIGSFFHVNPRSTVPLTIVDEVAAVNDSMPNVTEHQRKIRVAKWLHWKLEQCGLATPRKART